jgi:hypothetical protein
MLDGPLDDPEALAGNLRDLSRSNRWLGGLALSRSALVRLAGRRAGPGLGRLHDWRRVPLRVLDVGTGAADIPRALLGWARRHRLRLEVTATDERPEIVAAARELVGQDDGLRLEVADVRRLPYPDASFEIAHASLVLHHLEPQEAEAALGELGRVARLGVVVNDLDRSWLALFGAWLLSRLATRNPLSRYDAPLSVRRAYRAAEVAQMASRVGLLEEARIGGFLGHRYAICLVPASGARPDVESRAMSGSDGRDGRDA